MPKRVAEAGEGGANGYGVYGFIRELITEGKDAEFVDNRGRYRLNWPRALDRYADYKAEKNPHFKGTNQNRRKASNSLRSALLNFYKKEGAREYKESKKVNERDQVVERQFQMPPRVFEALFSNARLSDSNEEQDEQERKRHLSEGGVGGQASPESSSDAGFDESMDLSCDFSGSPEPLVSTSFGNFLTSPSLDNSPDVRTEGPGTHFSDCAFQTQIFDEDSVESAVEEICSESDEISGLMGVVDEIFPASGSVKGGYRFDISLSEPLPENVSSGMAEFEGVGTVPLIRVNPFKLCGFVPASDHPRDVGVKVSSQSGKCLGCTCFHYVDEMREIVRQLIHDPEKLSSFLANWSEECHSLDLDMQFQGDVDATTQAKQKQSVKILALLVYTAAQTGAKQFIEMIFSTSAQRIVFDSYKERATLPEDVARANGHCDLAEYLEDITIRLTKEVDNQPKVIDWLELWNAVQNQVYVSQDEESKEETTPAESDDNSSDCFADAETSSCGSFEHDDVFTSNPKEKDAAEKGDGWDYVHINGCGMWRTGLPSSYCGVFTGVPTGTREASDVETTSKPYVIYGPAHEPLFKDVWKGFFICIPFGILVLLVILLAEGTIDSRFPEDPHMANNRFFHSEQRDIIDLVLSRHRFYPKVQNKTVLSQIMELLRQCGSDEDGCTGLPQVFQPQIFLQQHRATNKTVTVSRIQRLLCRHHHRYDEVRSAACQDCPAGVNGKHCIDANGKINNGACGFSCTVYVLFLHASGGCVVMCIVSISQCAPHSFQPCQLYEKHQDEMTDPKILQQEAGHLSQFYHGDNMHRYQINEPFNDVFTFLYQELSTSCLDEIMHVKNEQFADSQCPFYAENLTHRKIYKSFKQCSTFGNKFNYTLINQTGSDKEPKGLVSIVVHLGLLLFLVTFLISIKIRRLSKGTSQMKQENAVFKANDDTVSTCRLKKENHKQILIPLEVYGTRPNQELGIIKKSIGDESVPSSSTLLPSYSVFNKSSQRSSSAPIHGLYSGNVSRIKETNMKEVQTERMRSWLSSNPNSEELPFSKGF